MVSSQLDLNELIQRTAAGGLGPEATAERIAAHLTPPERAALFKACLRAYCREVLTGTKSGPLATAAVKQAAASQDDHPWRQYPNLGRQEVGFAVEEETVVSVVSFRCNACREPFPDVDRMLAHRAQPGPCYSESAEFLAGG